MRKLGTGMEGKVLKVVCKDKRVFVGRCISYMRSKRYDYTPDVDSLWIERGYDPENPVFDNKKNGVDVIYSTEMEEVEIIDQHRIMPSYFEPEYLKLTPGMIGKKLKVVCKDKRVIVGRCTDYTQALDNYPEEIEEISIERETVDGDSTISDSIYITEIESLEILDHKRKYSDLLDGRPAHIYFTRERMEKGK